jgi:aminopeptidase N
MKQSFFITVIFVLFLGQNLIAQFTLADSLRGQLRPERSCYDVKFYDLNLDVNFKTKHINGYNTIIYKVVRGFNMLQIDLFSNMKIDSIIHHGNSVKFHRKFNAVFVDLGQMQEEDIIDSIRVYYQGIPRIAINAPWDGGFTWSKDKNEKPWLGVSCEGIGASLWWPNKDHLSDEPDSMRINCTVPSDLTCVSNGNLRSKTKKGEKTSFEWFVSYPINNYNVTLNIADYVHFSDTFISPTDGSKLNMDYYVLPYNLTAAKKQFKEAHEVIRIFEKYLDKYPFWNDGYALVETPYLGMEHQSCIAYGNQFMPGYLGRHPFGMPEDFIILHETGHEWWGNSVSCVDHGEMWIHETFCTYMEAVFMEEKYGKDAGERYLKYHNLYISNNQPILGPKDVNYDNNDSDMYYKGSSMLHTLRTSIGNDKLWWDILKSFYQKHKIKPAVTEDFINLVNEKTGSDYTYFFNQYLKNPELPILYYEIKAGKNGAKVINYKWKNSVANFKMPVYLNYKGKISKLSCSNENSSYELNLRKDEKPKFIFGLYRVVEIENGKEIEKSW